MIVIIPTSALTLQTDFCSSGITEIIFAYGYPEVFSNCLDCSAIFATSYCKLDNFSIDMHKMDF